MFLGHFGVGFGSKAAAPQTSLGTPFLAAIYEANFLGSAPPSVDAIAWAGQAQWLLVLLGYWADRHRSPRGDHRREAPRAAVASRA